MTLTESILEAMHPGIETEYRFDPARRWRLDWAWPQLKIALEHEGGTWIGGRHVRPTGYRNDCEKYSRAAILGWIVIRATSDMLRDGSAFTLIEQALQARRAA